MKEKQTVRLQDAVEAISLFNQAGIFTYLNACLTKEYMKQSLIPYIWLSIESSF